MAIELPRSALFCAFWLIIVGFLISGFQACPDPVEEFGWRGAAPALLWKMTLQVIHCTFVGTIAVKENL